MADNEILQKSQKAEETEATIEKIKTKIENTEAMLEQLEPWQGLETAVEELGQLKTTTALTGLLPIQKLEQITADIAKFDAAIEIVGTSNNNYACIVICLKENLSHVQKLLRSSDFDSVSFEPMKGNVSELIEQHLEKLHQAKEQLEIQNETAYDLAEHLVKIQTLCDHYSNLLNREQTESSSPATDHTVIFEGWVKEKDYKKLEKIVAEFSASSISKIEPAETEEVPIEIDNNKIIKPFELVTRLYGMPKSTEVDPTVFLAPFFAIFFGLCMTDVGYGVVMAVLLWWMMKKIQGDKGALLMFFMCSITTMIAGALTGGWFGDAIVTLIPENTFAFNALNGMREKLMLFDPMKDPPKFFALSLGLGYIQILFGLAIGFFNSLKQKDYATAVFNYLTWLIFLNSLLLFGISKGGLIPKGLSPVFGWIAIIQAVLIFLFSERKTGMAGRIGGGVFALFGTVFYFGDILSYVRLMALGMVATGLGMAVNILVKLVMPAPYGIGYILGAIIFIGGHTANLALGALSSFVHSLRLQFVEFFPKFLEGGGKLFEPLCKEYKHVYIKESLKGTNLRKVG